MKHKLYYFLIAFLVFPFAGFCGGFQVNLQGTNELGMGHCGTALRTGSGSVFFNPGAFAALDSNYFGLSANLIFADVKYLEQSPGVYTSAIEKSVGTPFSAHFAIQPSKKIPIKLGFATYTPFGSGIKYPDNWLGQFVLREMSLRAIFYQPTIGFEYQDKLAIGFGYVYGTGNFLLRKGIPLQDVNNNYGEAKLEGKGSGNGFNLGIFFTPTEKLAIGMSYRSSLTVSVDDGAATYDVVPYLKDSFADGSFSTSLTLPSVANVGVSYQLNEKLMLTTEINMVQWSVYDTLAFDFENNSEILEDINSPREYENTFIFRVGGEFTTSEKLKIRAGAYFDQSPVQDDYITPETPDSDKLGLTAGASYTIKNIEISTALLYVKGKKRTAVNAETQFGGTWNTQAWIPSFSLQYIF